MWRSAEKGWALAFVAATLAATVLAAPTARAQADMPDPRYWLGYGKTVELCPGSTAGQPFKIEGSSWGLLASGVVLCQDRGDSYTFTVDFLNVSVDPVDRALIKREVIAFDWLGLALYRKGPDGADWLFDRSLPVKGELKRAATGRIVFGHLTFDVPKAQAAPATNMLFYLTFDGPLVALHAL